MSGRKWRTRLAMRTARAIAGGTWNQQRLEQLESAFELTVYRGTRDALGTQAVLAAVLRPDSHVIDIGANKGEMLDPMVQLAPHGRYLAYEPIPHLAQRLAERFPKALVRQVALSNQGGSSTFHLVVDEPAFSGLLPRPDVLGAGARVEQITVELCRLDDDLPADFCPGLIKIDVEGAEVRVLEGAASTLQRFNPVVLFEHGRTDLYETTSGQLWDMLTELGYRIFNLEGDGPYSRDRFRSHMPEWNYIGIPSRPASTPSDF